MRKEEYLKIKDELSDFILSKNFHPPLLMAALIEMISSQAAIFIKEEDFDKCLKSAKLLFNKIKRSKSDLPTQD